MNVVIMDTGCANLSSVKWAIERLGYRPEVSRDPDVVLRADKLFLPGVGTAKAAMTQLEERDLIDLVKACTQPVLGICLGMQLLGRGSDENGGVPTLGIIDEPVSLMDTQGLPLPHMGWNQITAQAGNHLFRGIDDGSYFYFVHSYAMPVQRQHHRTVSLRRSPSPQRCRRITSSASSSTRSVRAKRAHSC
ncbi:imidazole glycerol phosphate synthase subunit HisH [Pantoea sp. Sc1]|nr:imidazole glycerol phosphate synthase subunit HisH [Pantoea sp. Sc1]